jgi:putative ABC transport system substrate-binding protein
MKLRRRQFLALTAAALAAYPRIALAQQAKLPRVAWLYASTSTDLLQAVLDGFQDAGLIDRQNFTLERFEAPTAAEVPNFAARALSANPDVIVATGSIAVLAIKALTNTTPIVFGTTVDPVAGGFVSNLARPTRNLTGATSFSTGVVSRLFGILKGILPRVTRVACLADVDNATAIGIALPEVRAAAGSFGAELNVIEVHERVDLAGYVRQAKSLGAQAIYLPAYAYYFMENDGKALADLRAASGVPTTEGPASNGSKSNYVLMTYLALLSALPTFGDGAVADYGGLIGYGTRQNATLRQLGGYVAAILKGAKPGDLPVQLATAFDFVVNLKAAKALGIAIPAAIFAQATRLIEYAAVLLATAACGASRKCRSPIRMAA